MSDGRLIPPGEEDAATAAQSSAPTLGSAPGPGPSPAPESPPELVPFETLGNYQVLKHLGGGGMAEVYAARSLLAQGVDKLVALKTVRNEFGPQTRYGAMFLDEARVSATLQHPNIVQVFDYGEAAGRPYLAMELVPGRDLAAVIRGLRETRTPAPPAVVVAIGVALCRALEYVHERKDLDGKELNLVHRDVGPANVLLTPRAEVKLMDFGVASTQQSQSASSGLFVGKLPYMPPEQLKGEPPAPGWDLYPAGVTLYQLATLYHPWQGNPADYLLMETLRFHRGAPSGANGAIPPLLDQVLLRATQLDANVRYPSARALREALEQAQRQTGPADLGAWVKQLFGGALAKDEAEYERLMGEARRRTASRVPQALRPLLAPLVSLRRAVVYSGPYRALARRPRLLRAVQVGLALALLSAAGAGALAARDRAALREGLARVDAQAAAGRLLGAGSSGALDLLLDLRGRWPKDPRVQRRLDALAARFDGLGKAALEREALEEAGAHLEAALKADPAHASARTSLAAVEDAVRARSKDKVVQSP